VLDLAVAVLLWVFFMPVVWKWIIWFLCWFVFVYLGLWEQLYWGERYGMLPKKSRKLGICFFLIIFCVIFNASALSQWKEEMSKTLEGNIHIKEPYTFNGFLLGNNTSGLHLTSPNSPQINIYDFCKISLRVENGKPLLTTDVRDREGNLVVHMVDNHWEISSFPLSWEHNYTNSALEVKDKRGFVVFQEVLHNGRIQLLGEWWNEYHQGFRVTDCIDRNTSKPTICVVVLTDTYHPYEPSITPIFKYPAKDHFGEAIVGTQPHFWERSFLFRVLRGY
jgi:hypothetical protein